MEQQSLLINQTQAAQLLGVCINTFKKRFEARLLADKSNGQKLFARAAVLNIANELKDGSQTWTDSTSAVKEKTGMLINKYPAMGAFTKALAQRTRQKQKAGQSSGLPR